MKVYEVIAHLLLPVELESTTQGTALVKGPRRGQGEEQERDVPHRRGAGGVLGTQWRIVFPHMGHVLLMSKYANGEMVKEVLKLLVITLVELMVVMVTGAQADPR